MVESSTGSVYAGTIDLNVIMGCDIHLYVENKDADGRWRPVNQHSGDESSPKSWKVLRNYGLFAILAGVRNYCTDNRPITEPLGRLPSDVSQEIANLYSEWDSDAYAAHSYTLSQLLEHDWSQPFCEHGRLTVDDACRIKDGEDPSFLTQWFPGTGERRPKILPWTSEGEDEHLEQSTDDTLSKPTLTARSMTSAEIRKWAVQKSAEGIEDPLVEMVWGSQQAYVAEHFLNRFIPALKEVGQPENVRIVFWFTG